MDMFKCDDVGTLLAKRKQKFLSGFVHLDSILCKIVAMLYTVSGKRGHVIFNYNSRFPWSIFIIYIPLETGMNIPQLHVLYLLKLFMTS